MRDEIIKIQVENILSNKNIFDFTISFTSQEVHIKINEDKTAKINFSKFSDSQIISNNPKWIKCLTCNIEKTLVDCACVWVLCIHDNHKFEDLSFQNTNIKIKQMYKPILNGFSCYARDNDIETLLNQNGTKITLCEPDATIKINANNKKQTIGQFIYRLGTNKSSRRAGTQKPVFPIPKNIYAFVVDTGILQTHPDLKAKISTTYSANFTTTNKSQWNDQNGHGTHVAGIIGAIDNTIGIVGNAPGVNLVAIRVLDKNGFGSYSNIITAINYIAQWKTNNPNFLGVVNMSLGGPIYEPFDTAVKNLINNYNTTVVVAAGNETDNANNYSPSNIPKAITVGAYDGITNKLASFSNYGTVVDILAPGVSIDSCYLNNGYAILSGTSMASPMVAGAVVDILANTQYSKYTPAQIRDKIVADAKVLNPVCNDGTTGSNPVITLTSAAKNANTTDRSVYIGTY